MVQLKVVMERCKFPVLMLMVAAASSTMMVEASTTQAHQAPSLHETAAGEPIMAIVSIESQQVKLYDADGMTQHAPVSTGTYGRETPAGVFAVVEKKKQHRSNMYDDAEMPNMHRITWNGIALHGGPLPGYPASHGCVRMPYGFARDIFGKTRIGMRVIISPYDAVPIEFSHPTLLTPNAEAVAAAPGRAEILVHEAALIKKATKIAKKTSRSMARKVRSQKRSLYKLNRQKKRADYQFRRANKNLTAADKAQARAEKQQRKAADKAKELITQFETASSVNDASQPSSEAQKIMKTAVAEAASLKASLRKLEKRKKSAEVQLRRADKALSATDKTWMRAGKRQRKATEKVNELAIQFGTTLSKVSLRKLEKRKKSADAELKQANKALSAAAKARWRADKQQRKAADKANELIEQVNTTKPDLEVKVAAAASAKEAFKAAKNREASLRKLKSRKKKAETRLRRADKTLSDAEKAKVRAEERHLKASTKAEKLALQVDTAKSDLNAKVVTAAVAKDAYKAARIRKTETAKAAYEAKLALEPVSVYISLATQKLYVRRNTHKPARDGGGEVFDSSIEVPITIRDPYLPIGTHVFTAMERNNVGLHWTVVTINGGDSARSALDRVTIPQHVLDRIEPTALPRSSIIISDEPLSEETNYRTEFVAVLSDQPQGGFITRKVGDDDDEDEEDEDEDGSTQWQGNSMFDPLNDF